MNDEEKHYLIQQMRTSLIDMAFGDINRASNGGAKMGAFILCSCYIDYLAGFRFGRQTTGRDYKEFINLYLKGYDPETVYHDLRCGIVHNYSEGGSYTFMHAHPDLHFYRPGGMGKISLNLENFISDLETATNLYFEELGASDELLNLALQRKKLKSILIEQDHL